MADTMISALPAVTSPLATDVVPIVSSATNKKVTIQNAVKGGMPTWTLGTSTGISAVVFPVGTLCAVTDLGNVVKGDGLTAGGIGWDTANSIPNNFVRQGYPITDPTGDVFINATANPCFIGFGSDWKIKMSAGQDPPDNAGLWQGATQIMDFDSALLLDFESKLSVDWNNRQGAATNGTTISLNWSAQYATTLVAAATTNLASELGSFPNTKAVIDSLVTLANHLRLLVKQYQQGV